MLKLKEIQDEKELEDILLRNPELLEEGLKSLTHQLITRTGPMDLLCLDSAGKLVVVELKIHESNDMLLQAFRYYDYINENRDTIRMKFNEHEIAGRPPRLALVAPSFSEELRLAAKYIAEPKVELFKYFFFEREDGKAELFCQPLDVGSPSVPIETKDVDDFYDYIRDEQLRDLCKSTVSKIKTIGGRIEVKPTQFYIGLLFKNRLISRIHTYRERFDIYYPRDKISGDWREWECAKVTLEEDIQPEIIEHIKMGFGQLGGKKG